MDELSPGSSLRPMVTVRFPVLHHGSAGLFLIQAWDDVHLTPTYVLGGELAALEKQHETRIYQQLGTERGNGHGVFNKGVDLWSADVRRFLARWV